MTCYMCENVIKNKRSPTLQGGPRELREGLAAGGGEPGTKRGSRSRRWGTRYSVALALTGGEPGTHRGSRCSRWGGSDRNGLKSGKRRRRRNISRCEFFVFLRNLGIYKGLWTDFEMLKGVYVRGPSRGVCEVVINSMRAFISFFYDLLPIMCERLPFEYASL